jgi:hypothetical protein
MNIPAVFNIDEDHHVIRVWNPRAPPKATLKTVCNKILADNELSVMHVEHFFAAKGATTMQECQRHVYLEFISQPRLKYPVTAGKQCRVRTLTRHLYENAPHISTCVMTQPSANLPSHARIFMSAPIFDIKTKRSRAMEIAIIISAGNDIVF